MKLGEIAQHLQVALVGDAELEIHDLAPIEAAQAGHLTFLSNKKYRRFLPTTQAAAIIVEDAADVPTGKSGLVSTTPYLTFAQAMWLFHPLPQFAKGIHPLAVISPSAVLGEQVTIGPFTVIGDHVTIADRVTILSHCSIYPGVTIGENSFLHSHCIVREHCQLGARVTLQNNVTIGTDGFGYAKQPDHAWFKIPQAGIVIIEDEVEIGAGSTIDRATIGATVIGKGTKIDNLVQIGHGSSVGQNTLLCAQVGLAGSTQVGNEVILSGQVGAAGHLTIGDRVIATAQTGIPSSVEPGRIISGYPAIDNKDWLRASAVFAQLPQLNKQVRALKAELQELKNSLNTTAAPTEEH